MRSFVAIELPAEPRRRLERRAAAWRADLPAARWVAPRNYHLTLVFLGEIEASQASALAARLGDVVSKCQGFHLQLEGGGCFPPRGAARVVWAGLAPEPRLLALQSAVAEVCREELELAPERRPYHPHLTLARCRRPWPPAAARRWSAGMEGPIGPGFAVRQVVLMESRPEAGGVVYRPIETLPLGTVS